MPDAIAPPSTGRSVGRLLAKLAPKSQGFGIGGTGTDYMPLASQLAAAIASAQPHGAQLIAWVKYAQDASASQALLRELLLESVRWEQSASLAKRQQLRIIIAAAFAEWLAPKACTNCGGRGATFVRGEGGAMTEHDCLPCGGSGRVPLSDNRRAENCGLGHGVWRNRLNGDRARVYERVLVTLRRWDRALLATVAEAMRAE